MQTNTSTTNAGFAPKVSILIPIYNNAQYLQQCIDSVINQTLQEIEIILINDGSTDQKTLEILNAYSNKNDQRLIFIHKQNTGYGHSMNIGFQSAHGEYIGIVESDDFVDVNMYQDLYTICKENNLDFIKSDFYRFITHSNGLIYKYYCKITALEHYYNKIINTSRDWQTFLFTKNTWNGLYKRSFLLKNNILHNETPGASFQDNGFWFQTFYYATKAFFLNKAYYMNRRDNENSSIFSDSKIYAMKNEYDFITKTVAKHKQRNFNELVQLINKFRFVEYYYNTVLRIKINRQYEFLKVFSNEFLLYANKNQINQQFFTKDEWSILKIMIFEFDLFYFNYQDFNNQFMWQQLKLECELKVSLIVPVYNTELYLAECLSSLLAQSFRNLEIICVNDGSTDHSLQILQQFQNADSRIIIVNQKNCGLSGARNKGLEVASGKYVFFVDSDDYLQDHAVDVVVKKMETEQSDIACFGILPINANATQKHWIDIKNPIRNITYTDNFLFALFREPGAMPFAVRNVYRLSFLREHKLTFISCFGEDTIFSAYTFSQAHNIVFLIDKLYYYRMNRTDSLMSKIDANYKNKLLSHIVIVSHILSYFIEHHQLNASRQYFAQWALNFIYTQFNLVDDQKFRYAIANVILNIINKITNYDKKNYFDINDLKKITYLNIMAKQYYNLLYKINQNNMLKKYQNYNQPKISFIIPTYNMVESLSQCLRALFAQTLQEIEIICVNDASQDNTEEILNDFALQDQRLKFISYSTNKSANQARKDAVLLAHGEYILFCDADDTYTHNAAELLYHEIKKDAVDILHFNTLIVNCNANNEDIKRLNNQFMPFAGTLNDVDVFLGCFKRDLYNHNLVNKLYSAPLLKKAFSYVADGYFQHGEDLYAFFIIAYFASSYRGYIAEPLYVYNVDTGENDTTTMQIEQFSKFVNMSKIVQALYEFAITIQQKDFFEPFIKRIEYSMLGDCVKKWTYKISDPHKAHCFDLLLQYWDKSQVIGAIVEQLMGQKVYLTKILRNSQIFHSKTKKIKKIALYYHRLIGGEVEERIQYLTEILKSLGYQIILITDFEYMGSYVVNPYYEKRYIIPNYNLDQHKYHLRAKQLKKIIEKECFDLVIYHAQNTELLLYDMLIYKCYNIAFSVYCHSPFFISLIEDKNNLLTKRYNLALADAIICLSKVDYHFWHCFNANVHLVINPVLKSLGQQALLQNSKIIWVGRLSKEKNCEDAIKIVAQVIKNRPETTLEICGTGKHEYVQTLQQLVQDLGCAKNIKFVADDKDVLVRISQATIFLMTSQYESYPMALLQAKSCGLPIVMYDLPWLTLTENYQGIIAHHFGETDHMVKSILDLLQSYDQRKKLGQSALAHFQQLSQYDFLTTWSNIIHSMEEKDLQHKDYTDSIDNIFMMDLLLKYYQTTNS